MNQNKTIAVIGAGIVGLSCALWIQKKGFKVVLIDPEVPGSGTSFGNACTIADYGCVPVNSPDIFRRLPKLLFSADSPLTVNPAYAISHLPWMLSFLSYCRPAQVARISRILGKLLAKTYDGLDPLLEMCKARDLISQQGSIYVYRSEAEYARASAANQVRREQGVVFNELSGGEVRELEPHLKMPFARGLIFPHASQVLNPQTLCTRYFDFFRANQGEYLKQRALGVEHEKDQVSILLEGGEKCQVDRVVIAAGAFAKTIKGCGTHRVPLDTERGYHVQYNGLQGLLTRPVSWNDAGFYVTPMDQGLRVVGTVELAGYGPTRNQRHLDYLVNKGRQMFDLPDQPDQEWLGFRPTLPDALPVIGYSTVSEYILYAFGHNHLGLTLAGITGKLIAELINQETPGHNLKAFDAARFR